MNKLRNPVRKAIALILTVAMIFSSGVLVFGTTAGPVLWNGTVAENFKGGTGTEADPYQISNGAELALLGAKLAGNEAASYYNKFYKLTEDIVLNTGNASTWGTTAPANSYTAIGTWGTATSSFGGHFDGNGKTIKGLYISTANDGQGLFGVIQGGAEIKNFALVNSYIQSTGGGATGAIVGQTDRANQSPITISNVYTDATVICNGAEVGGIIGNLSNSTGSYAAGKVTVDRATFVGSVNGTNYVAGIVGNARNVAVDIKNCLVYADVESTQSSGTRYAAGIMAKSSLEETLTGTQTVTNCILAGGSVTCATTGTKRNRAYVSQSSANYKASVSYCYDAVGITDVYNATNTGSEDIASELLYGYYNGANAINWATWANSNWASSVIDIVRPKGVAENFEFDLVFPFANGSGTENDPYEIANAADLAKLSLYSKIGTFADIYFELTADITLTGNNNHEAIGTWAKGFGGHFNGNGHTISGLHISTIGDGQGLFGVIQGGAVIENFALVNSYIASTSAGTSGAVVGQSNRRSERDITIQNIYTDAVVSCNGNEVGGIIGNISDSNGFYSAGTVTISNCVFNGKIESTGNYCGGIVGNARSVTVNLTNCANYGTITTGGQYVAGLLAGTSGCYTISGCVNTGRVIGSSDVFAIACCKDNKADAQGVRVFTDSYYLNGSAEGGVTKNTDNVTGINVLRSLTEWIGMNPTVPTGWTKRAGDLAVPSGVAAMVAAERLFTFDMDNGASIRFQNPTGLRFTAVVSKTYFNALANVTGCGIVIAPTSYVETAGEFSMAALDTIAVSGPKYIQIPAGNLLENNSDYMAFSGVLGNINEEQYRVNYSAVAYVEFGNGQILYSAYDPSFNSRSVAQAARLAHEDVTEVPTGDYTKAISIIPGVTTAMLYSPYTGVERAMLEEFYRKELRVLQQNLFRDHANTYGYGTTEERSYRFLKEVTKYDPDIILLQEVDIEGVWYQNALCYLTNYTLVGIDVNNFDPNNTDWKVAFHTAIMYRTERFTETDSGIFWLKDNPEQRGTASFTLTVNGVTGEYYENMYRQSCYVNLRDHNNNDAPFTCSSVHLAVNKHIHRRGTSTNEELSKAEYRAFRKAEAERLLNYLASKACGNPILFAGDFNDVASSKVHTYITNEGYKNSYQDTPFNVGGYDSTLSTTEYGMHIDWCFYSEINFNTLSYRVIADQYLNKSGDEVGVVSDHCGIISDILLITTPPSMLFTPPDNIVYADFAV